MDIYHVDGWAAGNPGPGGYRVKRNRVLICDCKVKSPHSINMYELMAVAEACKAAKGTGAVIYTDSLIVLGWIKNGPKASVMEVDTVRNLVTVIRESHIKIKFWNTRKFGENPADPGRKKGFQRRVSNPRRGKRRLKNEVPETLPGYWSWLA